MIVGARARSEVWSPLADFLGGAGFEEHASLKVLREPAGKVNAVIIGDRRHAREGDRIFLGRVRLYGHVVDEAILWQRLLEDRFEETYEAEKIPG